jgi:hypothetical protein
MGYTNVREYAEGKKAWIAAGYPWRAEADGTDNEANKGIQ